MPCSASHSKSNRVSPEKENEGPKAPRRPTKGTHAGAPATPAIPAVDPGLHGGSSGISSCARLISAAGPTPGPGRSPRLAKRTQQGGGGPGGSKGPRGGAGNRLIRSLFSYLYGASVYSASRTEEARGRGSPGRGRVKGHLRRFRLTLFAGPLPLNPLAVLVPGRGRMRQTPPAPLSPSSSAIHSWCQPRGERAGDARRARRGRAPVRTPSGGGQHAASLALPRLHLRWEGAQQRLDLGPRARAPAPRAPTAPQGDSGAPWPCARPRLGSPYP